MNEFKELIRTTPRRTKTQITIIGFSLILLIFVIYQVLPNIKVVSGKFNNDKEDQVCKLFFDESDTEESFLKVLKNPKPPLFPGEKLVHLDLKGAPPLVSYLKKFFSLIKNLGATGILIEYEDMFFYNEELEDLRALNAYTLSDIETILKLAEKNNLQVIPLIQTFGHLEFVLKQEKFKDLREVDSSPQALCPSHERVQFVIQKMIDQILKVHPKSKYIHIGSDEVMDLGKCGRCLSVMHQNNWKTSDLFLNHVKSIALYINTTYPNVRPIIWDDMIVGIDKRLLQKSQISDLVDLMVWKYVPNVSHYITSDLLDIYAKVFKNIWIASAFKGATGVSQIVTNAQYHLANHEAWMDIVHTWKKFINFKGIAVTGWQRYDHFAPLCELLPVGIPSLTLNMHYLNGCGKELSKEAIVKILQCQTPFALTSLHDSSSKNITCYFPGFPLYHLVNKLSSILSKIQSFSTLTSNWFSLYNIVHQFSNPAYVRNMFAKWPASEYLKEIKILEEDLKQALLEVYDDHTMKEWILTYVVPVRLRLEAFCIAREAVLEHNVWPRRPLLNNTDDLERAAKEICTFDRKFGCGLLLL